MYIDLEDYFGRFLHHPDATPERVHNADVLLLAVNALLEDAVAHGVSLLLNPKTSTYVGGEIYGGFRPQSCSIGAPNSAHKTGEAVDVYDASGLDKWITDEDLEAHGLYREHPDHTAGWLHVTTRAPRSGRRTFIP